MKEPSKKRNNKSMMKKSLLLILVAILLPMTASAYDAVVDGIYYNLDKAAKTAEVTSGDNLYVGGISIPQTISFEGVRYQVTSIGESAFKECQELLSADLPVGLLTIGKNAFEGCGLTSMVFPNSLKTIDEYAFWNCQSLASITIPESLTSIGDNAFYYCDNLKEVFICSPKLHCYISSNTFGYNTKNEATFYVPRGTMYYFMIDESDYGWPLLIGVNTGIETLDNRINLKEFDYDYEGVAVNLVCLSDEGNDITQSVEIKWFNSKEIYLEILAIKELIQYYEKNPELLENESSKELYEKLLNVDFNKFAIEKGSAIAKVPLETKLYYLIELNEEMGHLYREIPLDSVMVGRNDTTVVCHLQKMSRVNLSGRVSAEDISEKIATIHIKQKLNGKFEETYNIQTNNQGEFSLEVYDDDTEIIVSCDGYMDAVIHRSSLNGNGDLGVITLKPITGHVIPVNIDYTPVVSEEGEMTADLLPGGLYDLQLTLMNESTGNEITDFSVQYNGTLVINSGANEWDDIIITAKSKKKNLADASTTFYIDERGSVGVDLNFIELGGVSASFTGSNNSQNAGYIYGSNGFLVARGVYNGETLTLRHLPQGTYTLVSIGQSSLLSGLYELSRLSQLNLVEGKDYVTTQVEVKDGEIATVSAGIIPKLNESLFLYRGSLIADKSAVVIGSYVTLSARVNVDKDLYDKVNNVNLSIDIPEGCKLVENSVQVDKKAQSYTLNGKTISMHLTKEQAKNEVKCCVVPTEANAYHFTAYVSFDNEVTVPRPIGVAQFEGESLAFAVSSTTADKNITISGLTNPDSEVKIFDGDVLIGMTTSKSDGTWMKKCELYDAYNLSFHDILVKSKTQEGMILTSDVKEVLYDKSYITPTSVSMTFYNGWHKDNITVDFDLINGTTSAIHYDFYNETDFTFLANFTRNDTTVIKDVNFMVKASDGTIRVLPALFDSKQQAWVATSKYDSYKLPQNVTVDYVCIREESDEEREEVFREQAAQMAMIANHIYNFIEDYGEMRVVEENETSALLDFVLRMDDHNVFRCEYRVETIPFAEAETMMRTYQFAYIKTEEGGIGTYTEITDNSISVVFIDLGGNEAYRITLSDPYNSAKKNSKGKTRIKEFLSELGSEFVDGLEDILGLSEFVHANKDFDLMRKKLDKYQKKYDKKRDATTRNILAKCPDGSSRLSKKLIGDFWNEMQTQIWTEEDKLIEKYNKYLTEYKKKLGASVATFVGTLGLEKYLKSAKFVNSKLNKAFQTTLVKNTSLETSAETLGGLIGQVSGKVIDGIDKIFAYKDFEGVRDKCLSWSSKKNAGIIRKYTDLNQRIKNAYNSCKKEKDPETITSTDGKQEIFNEKKDNNTILFTTPSVQPILDPSGYVYEAVLSNRLPGVTTTVYQKKNGSAVKWNAEDYSQQNPLVTDEAGFYRWDVPQGEWQVKYEKDGYETCYSEWLPVPPPQLDVNVGMKQTTPPAVKLMRGSESGITIEMSKYMLPESLNEKSVVVKMDGATRNGHLEMLNTEESPAGEKTYVSKVKFVPEDPFVAGDEVDVTVKGSVESYCSVQMGSDHTEKVRIEPEITAIIIDSVLTVPYQGTKTVQVLVMPQEVSAGKTLNARLSSSLITSLANERIVVDENGLATLTLNGDLPGAAQLTLTMDKVDITAESMVRVDVEYEVVNTPTASIRNGEQVGKGTQLSLSCATEGATIYYTLDGSCPCNEDIRILYTGPFELPEGVVTVKVMAEAEYLYDSDVATFVYQVNSSTGINKPTTEGHRFTAAYANGYIVIDGAEGADCKIYDMAGRELAGKQGLSAHDAVQVQKADTYVISIKHADGKMAVKKIMRR